jgi:hypothetical protein
VASSARVQKPNHATGGDDYFYYYYYDDDNNDNGDAVVLGKVFRPIFILIQNSISDIP